MRNVDNFAEKQMGQLRAINRLELGVKFQASASIRSSWKLIRSEREMKGISGKPVREML